MGGPPSASMSPRKLHFEASVRIWALAGIEAGLRLGVRSVFSIQVGVEIK